MVCARLNLSNKAIVCNAPFAQGASRIVAMGYYTERWRNGQPCVCKWFKNGPVYEDVFFTRDIKAVAKAQEIIDAFNSQDVIREKIYLNHPDVWVFSQGSKYAGQKALVEPYIQGFQKFNSNSGYVGGSGGWYAVMQALSHFSYHCTAGQMVLCDLQGGILSSRKRPGAVLTDPAILSRHRSYGVTDLGPEGISTFFARHQCNRYCRADWQQPRRTNNTRPCFCLTASTTMHLPGIPQQQGSVMAPPEPRAFTDMGPHYNYEDKGDYEYAEEEEGEYEYENEGDYEYAEEGKYGYESEGNYDYEEEGEYEYEDEGDYDYEEGGEYEYEDEGDYGYGAHDYGGYGVYNG